MPPMSAERRDGQRKRELAAIHVAKAQLGLDDETYRLMLWTVARARSAADLDHAGRRAVIEHLRKRGFTRPAGLQNSGAEVQKSVAPARDHGKKPAVPADRQALVNKIEALLAELALPWNYVRAIARKRFGMDQLEWASADQLRRLVAMLEYHRRRKGAKRG